MNLIQFIQLDKVWEGTAAGYPVATVVETAKGFQIASCLGVLDPVPPFKHSHDARHACQAYFLKFLFDLGFTPSDRVSIAQR